MTGTQRKERSGKRSHLTLWIVIAIAVAIFVAILFPHFAERLKIGGEIFLRVLRMMVVPLVVASVMSGVLGLGDVRKLGRPGGYAVLYYLSTTILAVLVGLLVVNILRPGDAVEPELVQQVAGDDQADAIRDKLREGLAQVTGVSEENVAEFFDELEEQQEPAPTIRAILEGLLLTLFTDNLFGAAVRANLLPLILFSLIFAGMLTTMGSRVRSITEMITQVNEALMAFILLLMKIAPLGIFCLVAARFGEARAEGRFLEELSQIGWYFGTVMLGLAFHAFVTLPLIYWVFTRRNPYVFLRQMSQALLTAFSTASSSATLPVTMECAHVHAGVPKRSVEFVLPLGATVNMDGTALYEAVAAIFIAQAIGMPLGVGEQAVVAVTATLAAIGAAGIPEAGLVTMIIVLNAVGLPVEFVGLIISVDWLLDRFRTAVNAFGDSIGSAVVAPSFPQDATVDASGSQTGAETRVASESGPPVSG